MKAIPAERADDNDDDVLMDCGWFCVPHTHMHIYIHTREKVSERGRERERDRESRARVSARVVCT